MAERIWLKSFIATAAVGRPGRVSGLTPGDVARPISSRAGSDTGGTSGLYSGPTMATARAAPRWRRGRVEGLAGGEIL